MTSSTLNGKSEHKPLHIASLGSSFAAGPGIPPYINRAAGRSRRNYAHLLAERLDAKLTDLTISGATLKNVLSEPQTAFRTQFPPQVEGLTEDVDVVTVTGGGNGLRYIGGVVSDTLGMSFWGTAIQWMRLAKRDEEELSIKDVKDRFVEVVDAIRSRSPRARIYLVEYLTLFGAHTKPGVDAWLNEEQVKKHQDVAKKLKEAYRMAAEARPGVKVVPIAEYSWERGIGSDEPWVEGFGWGMLWG